MGTESGMMSDHGFAVLVVEDESLVRLMATDILMDAGYRVFEACDAHDALAILEGGKDIGVLFTDIEMPGMTGLALAGTVRTRWPAVAVLVTSGRVRPSEGELPAGASFLAKPYLPEELVNMLRAMLP